MSRIPLHRSLGDSHVHQHGGDDGRGGELAAEGVAVTPDGTHVYVANRPPTLSRLSTGQATRWWPRSRWGVSPLRVAVTPDGQHVYVTNSGDGTVSVIATATNTVVGPDHGRRTPSR